MSMNDYRPVKTPNIHITIGEAFRNEHGQTILRVKQRRRDVYDEFTLEQLILAIINAVR